MSGPSDGGKQPTAAKTVAIVAIASVVCVASVVVILSDGSTNCFPLDAHYYVPETHEIFVADLMLIPPIDRHGKEAVRAHLYGCGDCNDENRFLGYFEKYSDEAKVELQQMHRKMTDGSQDFLEYEKRAYELAMTERFYSIDGIHWVLAESPEGHAMQENLRAKCGSVKLVYCTP